MTPAELALPADSMVSMGDQSARMVNQAQDAPTPGAHIEDILQLYRTYYPAALKYAYRRLGNRADAEEVVQEVFLRLPRAMVKHRPLELTFRAWLYRVLTNEINHRFRRIHRYSRLIRRFFTDRKARVRTPQGPGPQGVGFDQLRQAANKLPGRYAGVLALRYFEQLSSSEIAAILQIPESTVRTRLQRGLSMLRAILAHAEGAD